MAGASSYGRGLIDYWSFAKLVKLCQNTRSVVNWLQELGVIAKFYTCPECSASMQLVARPDISDGCSWYCRVGDDVNPHVRRRSIRKGTWFESSNLTLCEILYLTYYWIEEYPQDIVLRELDTTRTTVVDWYSSCREVCYGIMNKEDRKIGGMGHIVEVDESLLGKKKRSRDKSLEGQWVFGGIDRETRECFLSPIHYHSAETLIQVIKDRILPGTTIYSNSWNACNSLGDEGVQHLSVNHLVTFTDLETGCDTNNIKGLWYYVKGMCSSTNRKGDMFGSYLSTSMYRHWRGIGDLFDNHRFVTFLKDVAIVYPPRTSDIEVPTPNLTYTK